MRNSTWKATGVATLAIVGLLSLGACSDDGGDDDDASGTDDTEATDDTGTDDTGTDDTGADEGGGDDTTLVIQGFTFSEAGVPAGGTLAVTNDDSTTHTVTSDDDAWDELSIAGGGSGEIAAPSEEGRYPFHCEIHTSMTGTLTVLP